jgi:hypothetical protein
VVKLAHVYAAADQIHARHRARRREREELRAYMRKTTLEAKRQGRLRLGG